MGYRGLSLEEEKMLEEIYKIHGLMKDKPLTVTNATRSVDNIQQDITEIGNLIALTRQ